MGSAVGNLEGWERNKAVIRRLPGVLDTLDRAAIGALFTEDFAEDWGTAARLPDGHPWRTD
jgi:hypothetical protein